MRLSPASVGMLLVSTGCCQPWEAGRGEYEVKTKIENS